MRGGSNVFRDVHTPSVGFTLVHLLERSATIHFQMPPTLISGWRSALEPGLII